MEATDRAALERFVHRLSLHSTLSPKEQDAIRHLRGQVLRVRPHRDLMAPGDTVEYSTLLAEGLLARFDMMRSGSRQITTFHIAGDMCDLYSTVAPFISWGITALSRSIVVRIAHADLRALVHEFPNIALSFWRDTTLDASILAKWVANVGRKDAQARIAHLLCELGVRMERAQLGARHAYPLPATQEQIGDAMGLTSVHVNRTLQALRAQGLITMRDHVVRIDDWEGLAAVGEFTPTFLLIDEREKQRGH